MKSFYLLRHEDVHGNSGTGVVAEGTVFDNGLVAMTWLSEVPTVTIFPRLSSVEKLHSHNGRTEVIVQGSKKNVKRFEECKERVRAQKSLQNSRNLHEK